MPLPDPISLGLPAKPGTAGPSSTPALDSDKAESGCAICSTPAKYTCPRCAARTCSLACSKAHKAQTGCSGQRDPTAFVPLNKITQGTWDGDYAYLEDGRRRVMAWGEGVSGEEASVAGVGVDRGGTRGRGGGIGGRGGKVQTGRNKKSKLDGLRWAVSDLGAEMDLLPDGMARRRTNQGSWNPKSRALYLTVQISIPAIDSREAQVSTHPRVAVLPRAAVPITLRSLLPEPIRSRRDIVLVLPYHLSRWRERQRDREAAASGYPIPALPLGRKFFPPIDADAPLDSALAGMAWIEFPAVHVFTTADWQRGLVNHQVAILPLFEIKNRKEEGPPAKKAKTEPGTLTALGDYDSDSDAEDAEAEEVVDGVDEAGEGLEDEEEGGDVELSPEMAAALGQALVADFGV